MNRFNIRFYSGRKPGQGVIEYAGAMIVAALIVVMLITGTSPGNWMYNAYNNLYNAAGGMLLNRLATL